MSKYLNTTNRTIAWFKKAHDAGDLEMKPPFQRNPVWTDAQKSYLIDTVLRGMPIPEIYMQELIDAEGNEKQILVDGQQRIRACLQFIEEKFAVCEDPTEDGDGRNFDDLEPDEKRQFYGYTFIVRKLPEMSDDELRGIFQRLNRNVVALNAQELRQATYWGPFIKTMQEISNYPYWSTTGVFTPLNVRRMIDVEFISELAIAVLHDHQNKKESLDGYYQAYEQDFEQREELLDTFRSVLFEMEHLYPDMKNTRWKKKTDFYSLFTLLASKKTSLPLNGHSRLALRGLLDAFATAVTAYIRVDTPPAQRPVDELTETYARAIQAGSDLQNRRRRHAVLAAITKPVFGTTTQIAAIAAIGPMELGLFEAVADEEGA